MEVPFVFFHCAVINDLFDGMDVIASRILACVSVLPLTWMTLLMYSLEIVLKDTTQPFDCVVDEDFKSRPPCPQRKFLSW